MIVTGVGAIAMFKEAASSTAIKRQDCRRVQNSLRAGKPARGRCGVQYTLRLIADVIAVRVAVSIRHCSCKAEGCNLGY